ncbi:site-specific integrase [Desulforhopalus sp. IMCC35007]|uniref:site-specific integrase n=1 Tax=Desulforhopalus sp. IMCC35007 TaxID=2569543 RepID=UPI0010AEC74D|nr:site-specific integrase [Desulforhopalus sp. IMCC35007]TKB07779.1 site-specific integrase [Desulforhopalus sp. IMCC35007]
MPRFRSTRAQAEYAISQKINLGSGRHDHQNDGYIHSVGTARGYEQALKGFAEYLQANRQGDLQSATEKEAQEYLASRAETVAQKTLDLDRQAIQLHLGIPLEVVKSEKETILSTRSYTPVQVDRIASAQTERNSLATEIASYAGLRAHELLTLRPAGERQASNHRQWSTDRFSGRTGVLYTVEGKGGLIREIILTKQLASRLEEKRLVEPRQVTDRGVNYTQRYDVGGGQTWSQSFSAASKRELGFSNGAHGLRHSYAQNRMKELQRSGMQYDQARKTVAQEVGHFDKKTTEAYLR